ncbi:MAG: DUF6439 family protein [Synechococcus sp.]
MALWPEEVQADARLLHEQLRLGDRDWHRWKADADRRAAEQLAAALAQLLQGQTEEAEALADSALRWLRRDQRDPGCPRHGSRNP